MNKFSSFKGKLDFEYNLKYFSGNIVLEKSWIIGDSTRDVLTAKNAGMKSILVKTGFAGRDGNYLIDSDFIAEDLRAAVEIILKEISSDC